MPLVMRSDGATAWWERARSHNIAISSDQAARQEDVPVQAARVSRCHCSGFALSYLVVAARGRVFDRRDWIDFDFLDVLEALSDFAC